MRLALFALFVLSCVWGCSSKEDRSDRSSPASAAIALADAIDNRDADGVRKSFSTEADQAYVAALAKQLEAFGQLKKAAAEKYGTEASKQLDGLFGPSISLYDQYKQAKAEIAGDTATLACANGRQMKLRKEAGAWKVVAEGSGDTSQAAKVLGALAEKVNEVAGKIRSGSYSDSDKDKNIREIRSDLIKAREASLAAG